MNGTDLVPKEALQKGYDTEAGKIPDFSAKMSELCKFIWAGSLALFFAALTSSQSGAANSFYSSNKYILLLAAIFGSLALVFEYLQFVSAYKHAVNFVAWVEEKTTAKDPITFSIYNRNTTSIFSLMNGGFFVVKNVFAIVAAALIAFAVMRFAFV